MTKTILIYSGKGGVGKTTTTANIARKLVEENKKVLVIDVDIATPNMNLFFEKDSVNPKIISNSYKKTLVVFQSEHDIKNFLNKAVKEAVNNTYDYILIDSPPSLTELHKHLLVKLKLSGVLLVAQPNKKSIQDINVTCNAFIMR